MNQKTKFIPLKELCKNYKKDIVDGPFGSNLKRAHFIDEGVPVLKIQNIKPFEIIFKKIDYVTPQKAEELDRHSFRRGDIIITKLGLPLGISAIVENINKGIIVADLVRVRTDPNKIDTKYLCYHLNSPLTNSFLNSQQRGTTRPRIRISVVRELPISTPPLEEQKRIVEILDKAFEGIDCAEANTKKNLANARELFQSYLDRSFFQNNSCWNLQKLKDILSIQPRNGWSPPAKNHSDSGTPVLTLSSVTGFNFNIKKVKFTNAATKKDAHYWLKNGDFLMTRSNTPELVGHVGICNDLTEPTICCDLIMKMSIDNKIAETKFIYWYFRTSKLRKLITDSAQGANPTMKKINKGIVQNFPVLLPLLEDQRDIIEKIDDFYLESQKLEKIYQRKLEALAELKQSILQKAFTGKLT